MAMKTIPVELRCPSGLRKMKAYLKEQGEDSPHMALLREDIQALEREIEEDEPLFALAAAAGYGVEIA
jgi:hypothetical protein